MKKLNENPESVPGLKVSYCPTIISPPTPRINMVRRALVWLRVPLSRYFPPDTLSKYHPIKIQGAGFKPALVQIGHQPIHTNFPVGAQHTLPLLETGIPFGFYSVL